MIADHMVGVSRQLYSKVELREMPRAEEIGDLRYAVQAHQECLARVEELLLSLEDHVDLQRAVGVTQPQQPFP